MTACLRSRRTFTTAVGAWLAILIALFPPRASACVWLASEPHKVGDHFDVVVDGFEGPIPGIEIELKQYTETAHDSKVVVSAKTDVAGTAHFEHLRPGRYSVVTALAVANNSAEIVVEKGKEEALEERISLRWPARKVLHLKRAQGTLVSIWEPDDPSIALEGLRLTLLEGYSGKELETQLTRADGAFTFNTSTPGLYFVRVEGGLERDVSRPWGRHSIHGEIAILVNPTDPAALETIRLQILMSDCGGLKYTDKLRNGDPANN